MFKINELTFTLDANGNVMGSDAKTLVNEGFASLIISHFEGGKSITRIRLNNNGKKNMRAAQ